MSVAAITLTESHLPIPREKGIPLLGCLPEFAKSPLHFFNRLTNKYTDVVEFSLPTIDMSLVIDGDIAHQILVKQAKNFRKSDRDVQIMGMVLGKGLVTNNDTTHHKVQRKLVQPGFHFRRIQSYSNTMSDYTSQYISSWESGTRDISDDMFKLTMYIVCKTLFDISMDKMEGDADDIGQTMQIVQTSINDKFNQIFLFPDWVPTPSNVKLNKARNKLRRTIDSMITTRRLSATKGDSVHSGVENKAAIDSGVIPIPSFEDKGDMMSMLLQAEYEDGSRMSTELVMDELITLFVAGHETTSNALTWTFYLLTQHPLIQKKLQLELDQVLDGKDAKFENLENLLYTEMVIKESMRLLPPAWTLNARQANDDIVVGDYLFPKNKVVFVSPERFSSKNEKKIPKHVYIPFGLGPRVCIGQSFAMMEAKLILATVMQRFEVTLDNRQEFDPQAQITLSNKNGMKVKLKKRG